MLVPTKDAAGSQEEAVANPVSRTVHNISMTSVRKGVVTDSITQRWCRLSFGVAGLKGAQRRHRSREFSSATAKANKATGRGPLCRGVQYLPVKRG
jgi:hypothetical protein